MDFKTRAKFLTTIIVAANICLACSFWRGNSADRSTSRPVGELESTIPFGTKEPEIYQCEIVVTTFLNGEKSERMVKAARNVEKMRYDYPNGVTFLQISESEKYLIHFESGIYVQSSNGNALGSDSGETLKDFLTTKWLNERRDAKFENLGKENNFTKYRVVVDESTNSEINIFVDDLLKLPMKQEYFSGGGESKILVSAVELRNFSILTDETRFKMSEGLKKVSLDDYHKALYSGRN